MVHFCEFLKTWSCRSNSVTRQVSFNRKKIGGNCQNSKIQMRHFGWFSNTVYYRPVHGNGKKRNESWYVPCITRLLPFFTIFWGGKQMHLSWWQKHQKGGKKGHAASRVSLVKTVGPFFFGLIFSGPFVTWSVKDLVSHQFGTSTLAWWNE